MHAGICRSKICCINHRKSAFSIRTLLENPRQMMQIRLTNHVGWVQIRSKIVQGTFWRRSGAPWGAQGAVWQDSCQTWGAHGATFGIQFPIQNCFFWEQKIDDFLGHNFHAFGVPFWVRMGLPLVPKMSLEVKAWILVK